MKNDQFNHLNLVRLKKSAFIDANDEYLNTFNLLYGQVGTVGDIEYDFLWVHFDKIKNYIYIHPYYLEKVSNGHRLDMEVGKYYLSTDDKLYQIIFDTSSIDINLTTPFIGINTSTGLINHFTRSGIAHSGFSLIREVDKDRNVIIINQRQES